MICKWLNNRPPPPRVLITKIVRSIVNTKNFPYSNFKRPANMVNVRIIRSITFRGSSYLRDDRTLKSDLHCQLGLDNILSGVPSCNGNLWNLKLIYARCWWMAISNGIFKTHLWVTCIVLNKLLHLLRPFCQNRTLWGESWFYESTCLFPIIIRIFQRLL